MAIHHTNRFAGDYCLIRCLFEHTATAGTYGPTSMRVAGTLHEIEVMVTPRGCNRCADSPTVAETSVVLLC